MSNRGLAAAVLLAASSAAPVATGAEPACLAELSEGRRLREAGELLAARDTLQACVLPSCLAAAQLECRAQLAIVEEQLPTIVVEATASDGTDLPEARLFVNGETRVLGRAIELDPGAHEIEITHDGLKPGARRVQVREGHKRRVVRFQLSEPDQELMVPWWTYAAFGVSGGALIAGGVVGAIAIERTASLDNQCNSAVGCTDGEIEDVVSFSHVSTALFVGAGAAAIVGVIGVLTAPSVAVEVSMGPSGGSVRLRF